MTKPIFSPFADVLLYAHQYQGNSNDCGPFSAAIVLNALRGLQIDGIDLAYEMNQPRWQYILPIFRRIPDWATFPWGIVDILREYRLESTWRIFTSIRFLQEGLSKPQVLLTVLGNWKPLWSHIVILAAFHEKMGWGVINPAYPGDSLYWIPNDEFMSLWHTYGNITITSWIRS
ncbi:MAG: hypothetical protein WCI88_00315 [Chloroflexota bacterium]